MKQFSSSLIWLTISELVFNIAAYVVHSVAGRILGIPGMAPAFDPARNRPPPQPPRRNPGSGWNCAPVWNFISALRWIPSCNGASSS